MSEPTSGHKIPRIGAAAVITVAGGTVMVGGQPASAADLVVTTDSEVFDGTIGDPDGPDDELSLADAVYAANQDPDLDTITFDETLVAAPIEIDTVNVPKIREDLRIVGPGTDVVTLTNSNGVALYVYNSADFTISSLTIDGPEIGGAPADGLVVGESGDISIDNVTIRNVDNGVLLPLVGLPTRGALTIENLLVENATASGIDANSFTDAVLDDVVITGTGNRGAQFGYATSVTASRVTISGTNNSAFDTNEVDDVVLTDIISTNTVPGTDLYAGRVSARRADSVALTNIEVSGARDPAVTTDSRAGVFVRDTAVLTAENITVTDSLEGIGLLSTGDATFDGVAVTDTDDIGVEIVQSWGTTSITDADISDNGGVGVSIDGTGASHPDGGVVLGDVTVTASTISGNVGGGVSVTESGEVEIDDVDVLDNGTDSAPTVGGISFGVDLTPSTSRIVNSTISGNEGDVGGGVSIVDSDAIVLVNGVTLEDNTAPFGDALAIRGDVDGGGEMAVGDTSISGHTGTASEVFASNRALVQMYNTSITDNSGASIIEVASTSVLSAQTLDISGNEASDGLLRVDGSEMSLTTSVVHDNTADTLLNADNLAGVLLQDSTFSGNSTVDSLVDGETAAQVQVAFSTLTENTVTDAGGTLLANDGSATLRSDSSIWSGNTANGWIDAPGAAADPMVDYSIVPTGAEFDIDGDNNIVTDDPSLGSLQVNGDISTLTHLPAKDSPAVDAANPTPPIPSSSDQRLLAREVNGRSDIGAVERQLSPFVVGLVPARVLETRTGPTFETVDGDFEGIGRRADGTDTRLLVAGRAGVPADAEAVVVNVTGVDPDGVGFVTVHPCLVNPPLASSLNFREDVDSGNEIVAELNSDGEICLFNRGVTDLVVDVVGYVPKNSMYSPVGPARLLDTRATGSTIDGAFEQGGTRLSDTELQLDVGGRGGVSNDATAVVINVTAVKPQGIGYVTVHPCLAEEPTAASLNFEPGVNRGNEIVAQLNADGQLCLYTFGAAELVVDVVGELSSENIYEPVAPARLFETRDAPNGTIDDVQEHVGRLAARDVVTVVAAGRADVPADAKGVVVNTTAIRTDNRGFLTVWDCVDDMPLAASLNYTTGEIVGNELIVDLNPDGEFCVFSNRATDLTVDVVGYLT